MKVTVTLLSNNEFFKKISNKLKYTLELFSKNIALIVIFFIFTMFLMLISKYIKIPKEILNIATNFREPEPLDYGMKDIISISGIFNAKNYLVKEKQIVNEEIIDVKQANLMKLDELAQGKDELTVFANKNIDVQITQDTDSLQRVSVSNMRILNYSDKRQIDYENLIKGVVNLTKSSDKILIYNTHTSESYANSEDYQFEYSGVRRSRDANYNMLSVANEFMLNLKYKGFNVTHNTTPHDYGTYDSAYARSRITVKSELEKSPDIGISIDLHRDAIADLDFRPSVNINGVNVAQCMFVMGVGYDDESNPYYEDNLKLALKLQYIADEIYPGLFRPIILRNARYNQDLNKYSILIEVGASGNTFDEAYYTTRCLTNLLNIIYKD